jgi:hypothetical protein
MEDEGGGGVREDGNQRACSTLGLHCTQLVAVDGLAGEASTRALRTRRW